jgi:maleate isomerase
MIRLVAAKLWLGKPVLTINAAIYWHVLPADGIAEKREGFGRIFEEF